MKWIYILLNLTVCVHLTRAKCPAPFPGEHAPCSNTCGHHNVCSRGLWCCDTPCGGTVCKIPDLPKEPVHMPIPQHHNHLSSHVLREPPSLQSPRSIHQIQEVPLYNQQQQIITPDLMTDLQPLNSNFQSHGHSITELQHNLQQPPTLRKGPLGLPSQPNTDRFLRQHLPTHTDALQNHNGRDQLGSLFPQDSGLLDFSRPVNPPDINNRFRIDNLNGPAIQQQQQTAPRTFQAPSTIDHVLPTIPSGGTCPPDRPKVKCWHDPCKVTTCPLFPESICVKYTCGECQAKFTIDGVDITKYCHV